MLKKALEAAAILIVATVAASANEIPPCRLVPDGVSATSSLASAPPAVVNALTERAGEVVPVGAAFDATDVVRVGKRRRLIFIWNRGARWVIATEHGGIAYNDPGFAFEFVEGNGKASFLKQKVAFPNSVCSTASSLLAE